MTVFHSPQNFELSCGIVALLQKQTELQNLGFFLEIVQFLEIHYRTNVFI